MAGLNPSLAARAPGTDAGVVPAQAEALVMQALRLLTTAEVAEPAEAEAARRRLSGWPWRSPAHAGALAEARRRAALIEQAAPALRQRWGDPIDSAASASPSGPVTRRGLLGLGGAGLVAALTAGAPGAWSWWQGQVLYAGRWRSGTGELLHVALPDAPPHHRAEAAGAAGPTELRLSPATEVQASLHRNRREARLIAGEAHFAVRPDAARPFTVFTRAGRVEVVGTAFTVADRGGAVTVAVAHGRVRFVPGVALQDAATPAATAAAIELTSGERLSVRDGQPPGPVERIAAADVAAWRSGWLVFDDVPLAEAVAAINAYRRTPLVLADAATGRLRLTARFHAADERALLAALPATLPVRVQRRADGRVWVEGRP